MIKKTKNQLKDLCENYELDFINVRNIKQKGKTRIKVTLKCKQCHQRFDVTLDTLKRQKYKGLCTKCAHKEATAYKKLEVEEIINRFESNGYKVLTPKDKIKSIGNKGIHLTPIEVQNKYGRIFKITCSNFIFRLNYYKDLNNNDYENKLMGRESRLECKTREYLTELNIPFKQEFRFTDCRGVKYPLSFDFCLFYKEDKKLLIEVDGERHFRSEFKDIHKWDGIKNHYCENKNIPLLRIAYTSFDEYDSYKKEINDFVRTYR